MTIYFCLPAQLKQHQITSKATFHACVDQISINKILKMN